MCSGCVEIDMTMAHHRRLRDQITDNQTVEAINRLIAELEAKKASLHSEEK